MRRFNPSRITLLFFSIAGVVFSLIIILCIIFAVPINNSYAKSIQVKVNNVKIISSFRLKIPKIKIDTDLEQVGLTAKGAVGVPVSILKAAWFNVGPRPGQNGSSIIVGHFGYKNGQAAIFNNIVKLKKGDKIYIEDLNGSSTTFIVQKIQSYPQTAKVTSVFISSDGKSHLNLITCDGIWDNTTKSYSQRLIIYTDKE